MQSAVQSANIELSRLPNVKNRMLRPSGLQVRKVANRDCVG
jgi:hypothetical protein